MKAALIVAVVLNLSGCAQNMLCQHLLLEKTGTAVHIEADCTLPGAGPAAIPSIRLP